MARKLVVCCDGTWNRPDTETNVRRIYEHLRAQMAAPVERSGPGASTICSGAIGGGDEVVAFYQSGVGTNLGQWLTGGALGAGLSSNVCDTYEFLATEYGTGDEIYVFGFSRGAYTARSLCGFVAAAGGLLQGADEDDVADCYLNSYAKHNPIVGSTMGWNEVCRDLAGGIGSLRGKAEDWFAARRHDTTAMDRHKDVRIQFVGVYDTVGALGVPLPALSAFNQPLVGFHDTNLGERIVHAVHALAVDEQRGPYKPTIWRPGNNGGLFPGQTCLQVWFPGVHSDVGGGYTERGIGDITLRFMLLEAERRGLPVDGGLLPAPDRTGAPPHHNSVSGVWNALSRFFKEITYDRAVGAKERMAVDKEPSPAAAAGAEMLHPSLVARVGKTVEVLKEDEGKIVDRKTIRYGDGGLPRIAGEINSMSVFNDQAQQI